MTGMAATAAALVSAGSHEPAPAAPAPDLWQAERVVLGCEIAGAAAAPALADRFCRNVSREAGRLWRLPVVLVEDAGLIDPLQDLQLQAKGRILGAGGAQQKVSFTLHVTRRGFPLERTAKVRQAEISGAGEDALRTQIAASLSELITAPRAKGSVPPLPKAW